MSKLQALQRKAADRWLVLPYDDVDKRHVGRDCLLVDAIAPHRAGVFTSASGRSPHIPLDVAAELVDDPAMPVRDDDVVAYLRDLDHPLRKEIELVRRVVLGVSPAIREGIKWNAPSFRTDADYFATFNLRVKDAVQLVFHLGAKKRPGLEAFTVADPNGLLAWRGKDRALVTLGAGRAVRANRAAFEAIVRAWIAHV